MAALSLSEWVLVGVCTLVSLFNASIGTTGGMTFAAMATVLPPAAVVPVHGLIEGTASAFRWALLRQFVDYRYWRAFLLGNIVGFVVAWPFIGALSDEWLRVLLGFAILTLAWVPMGNFRIPAAAGGAGSGCLTVLIGATGPLVAALLSRTLDDHRSVIATQGACTAFQHGGKAALFALWGFSFAPYWELIGALVAAIVVGTWLGRRILIAASPKHLKLALKVLVSVLGVHLIYQGVQGLWQSA
ncbi:MAG: sulfite exporter TauE/SafE family protein [Gammaproteobacteria bacterium]|nr:sulfite exporter TauE/SafE family protein [Gammaproteobacteria bacterium]